MAATMAGCAPPLKGGAQATMQDHAGQRLDLHIRHARALRLGKAADLGLGETDVLHVARGDLLHRGRDFGRREAEGGRVVAVEPARQIADGGIATGRDVGQNGLHRGAHLGIIRRAFRLGLAALEPGDRHGSLMHTFAREVRTNPRSLARCFGLGQSGKHAGP